MAEDAVTERMLRTSTGDSVTAAFPSAALLWLLLPAPSPENDVWEAAAVAAKALLSAAPRCFKRPGSKPIKAVCSSAEGSGEARLDITGGVGALKCVCRWGKGALAQACNVLAC